MRSPVTMRSRVLSPKTKEKAKQNKNRKKPNQTPQKINKKKTKPSRCGKRLARDMWRRWDAPAHQKSVRWDTQPWGATQLVAPMVIIPQDPGDAMHLGRPREPERILKVYLVHRKSTSGFQSC
jgi:hypothetical protein